MSKNKYPESLDGTYNMHTIQKGISEVLIAKRQFANQGGVNEEY